MTRQEKFSLGVMIAAVTLGLQLLGGIAAGVWMVSQISATTGQLQASIGSLTGAVRDLNDTVTVLQVKQHEHDTRLHVLERNQ